jgi:hypothetical protein
VPQPLVICRACRCHVRAGEAGCPHCGANLAEAGAKRLPQRRSFEVRRVVYATAALAGLSAASCGGRVPADETGTTSATLTRDIMGACMLQDGAVASCAWEGDAATTGDPACECGPAGYCAPSGICAAISCNAGQYLDSSGHCDDVNWFAGNLPSSPSTSGCYGAPPFLG